MTTSPLLLQMSEYIGGYLESTNLVLSNYRLIYQTISKVSDSSYPMNSNIVHIGYSKCINKYWNFLFRNVCFYLYIVFLCIFFSELFSMILFEFSYIFFLQKKDVDDVHTQKCVHFSNYVANHLNSVFNTHFFEYQPLCCSKLVPGVRVNLYQRFFCCCLHLAYANSVISSFL